MRKTKIIGTTGPTLSTKKDFKKALLVGINSFRFNMSHTKKEDLKKFCGYIRELNQELSCNASTLLDTKGPEIRAVTANPVELNIDDLLYINVKEDKDIPPDIKKLKGIKYIGADYEGIRNLKINNRISLNSGFIETHVTKVFPHGVLCKVEIGGTVKNMKHINLPGISVGLPGLTEKDKSDIATGIDAQIDYIAMSFVRNKEDVKELRRIIENKNGSQKIISKIEDCQGLNNINSIIDASDGIMVARGDLGVETSFEELPQIQNKLIHTAQKQGKIVIVATEMLESMIYNIRPTRAEVSDVALAVRDKADAIMLSAETANGENPFTTIKTMAKIAEMEENSFQDGEFNKHFEATDSRSALMKAACTLYKEINADALLIFTRHGKTARNMTWMRLNAKILAFTDNPQLHNQLSIYWGIKSFLLKDENLETILKKLREQEFLKSNDKVVVVSETILRNEEQRADSIRFKIVP